MKVFAMLALSMGALLATASAEAHSHPRLPKGLEPPVAHTVHVAPDSVAALASPTTGPTAHVSSSHPSFGGFHSTPSYHSYSPSPSRSFTFRSSSPSISTRPATTSAPRAYNYNPFARSARSSTPVSRPAEVHHYHNSGGGGGGLSATDVILLNQALNNSHQNQAYSDAGATGRYASSAIGTAQSADSSDEGISGWGIFGIVVLCLGIAGAVCFAVHRLVK